MMIFPPLKDYAGGALLQRRRQVDLYCGSGVECRPEHRLGVGYVFADKRLVDAVFDITPDNAGIQLKQGRSDVWRGAAIADMRAVD